MKKDFSNIPADKRIVNNTENDIVMNIRDGYLQVPAKIKSNETLSVKVTSSEDLAYLSKQCEQMNLPLEIEGPDITDIVVNITPDLRQNEENTKADAVIATLDMTGGTDPVTYSISGEDADFFILEGNTVKAKEDLTAKTYTLTFSAIDSTSETYTEQDEIIVAEPFPLITDININITEDIRQDEPSAAENAVIATLEVVGGTAPYLYAINGADKNKFKMEENIVKAKENLMEGVYNLQVGVGDENHKTLIKDLQVTVLAAYPVITSVDVELTPDLIEGEENTQIGATIGTISSQGGTDPIVYSLEGTDAAKFEISDTSINIKDNPLTEGSYDIVVRATDVHDKTNTTDVNIPVQPPIPDITRVYVRQTPNLREGETNTQVGQPAAIASVEGGTEPITFTLQGDDADKFEMVEGGVANIKDNPLTQGSYNITVVATDVNQRTNQTSITITVEAPYPEITDVTVTPVEGLREGEDNTKSNAVVANISITGGSEPLKCTLEGDDVPENLIVSNQFSRTPQIKVSRIPLAQGTYELSVKVMDAHSKTSSKSFTITVAEPYLDISDMTITMQQDIREGEANAQSGAVVGSIQTTGGTAPFTYSIPVTSGTKLVIDGDNIKVGASPLTAKTYDFEVEVTDSHNKTFTKSAQLVVLEAYPTITNVDVVPESDLREGEANTQVDSVVANATISGGTEPFQCTLSGNDAGKFVLENGTTNTPSVKIQGSPLAEGSYVLTLQVTDANNKTNSKEFTVSVAAAYPEITNTTLTGAESLAEGNPNVAVDAVVGTFSSEGGSEPFTYTLREDAESGKNNNNFTIEGSNLKVKDSALTEGEYKIAFTATDTHSKTKNGIGTLTVSADPEKPVITPSAPSGETALLGKTANDLQSNISISDNTVSGTVNYVTDYTEFYPDDLSQQEGNFLALKFEATNSNKITCELSEAASGKGPVQLDEDGLFVARLTNNSQTITVKAESEGGKASTTVLKLSGLTLTPKA